MANRKSGIKKSGFKIRRIISVVILITAIVVTQIPVTENLAAGSAGEFQMNQGTLVKYTGTASTVSVSDGVTAIGEEAFADNLGLNVISCGNNTRSIAFGAFANCTYLSRVSLPDSLESIDNSVFSGCSSLTRINFGENLAELGDGVFAGCNKLATISIDEDNTHFVVENGALYNSDRTILYAYLNGNTSTSYRMPDTVETIKRYAFWGNENLSNITLSSSLKEIPGYAFANCKNLQSISIPYSVKNIDAKAFENCISLGDTNIPMSVSYINDTAFDGCHRLNIIAEEGSVAYNFFQNFDTSDVTVAESDDAMEVVVSSNHSDGSSVSENDSESSESQLNLIDASDDPSNVEYMPKSDPLSNIDDSSVIGKTIVVNGNAVLFLDRSRTALNQGTVIRETAESEGDESETSTRETVSTIYDPQKGGYLPKYTETDNAIAAQAYYGNQSMQEYTFPSGINSIGEFSFARSGLQSVNIPQGVTDISYGAFYHCDNLSQVTIPNSVTNIEAYAFDNTPWVSAWRSNQDGNDYLVVGNHVLLAYKGNGANIEIPEGVLSIAPRCFADHTEIETVYLPDSLKVIGEESFRGCSNLRQVTGGNFVDSIEDRAFMECPVDTFEVSSTVKEMGLKAVDYSNTAKADNTKVVVFNGNVLPEISYGKDSQRLINEDYRENALHNVIFAVVNEECNSFDNTVLDGEKLGFSGIIVAIEEDGNGNETGYVTVKQSNVFSETVLSGLPQEIIVKGKTYAIKDFDEITLADTPQGLATEKTANVDVSYNGSATDQITASFSEGESVGTLSIMDSEDARNRILSAYGELFGAETPDMQGYNITLMDTTDTLPITKFGKAVLSVTMPIPDEVSGDTYHVVCLDGDGQLEEVEATMDREQNSITFFASHLSAYAIYATSDELVTLQLRDGNLVSNLKKDESPDTGDNSIPVKYPIAVALFCIAGLLFFVKGSKKKVTTTYN